MCWLVTRNLHEADQRYDGKKFGDIEARLYTSNPIYDGVAIRTGFGNDGSGITYFGLGAMHSPLYVVRSFRATFRLS